MILPSWHRTCEQKKRKIGTEPLLKKNGNQLFGKRTDSCLLQNLPCHFLGLGVGQVRETAMPINKLD